MPTRTLSPSENGSSGTVRLPKGDLELDGIVTEDGEVQRHQVHIRRIGPGQYEIDILDDRLWPIADSSDQEAAD